VPSEVLIKYQLLGDSGSKFSILSKSWTENQGTILVTTYSIITLTYGV